jgi:hypothetical protein
MPIIAPSIVNTGDGLPWIIVISGGQIDYDTIQQSIGQGYQFGLDGLYMKSNTIPQLLEPVTLEKNNRRGIFELKQFVPIVDPYQKISAINSQVIDHEQRETLTFNGLQVFVATILPSENVFFVFSLEEQSINNLMLDSPTNFEALQHYDYLADFPQREAGANITQRNLLVQLSIQNRLNVVGTPAPIVVSLLGGAADTYAQSSNAQTAYFWNTFTPEPYSVSSFTLEYKNVGEPTYKLAQLYGSFNTAQSWATALSVQTGLGLFWITYDFAGDPILTTTNDTLEFGNFDYTGTL